MKFEIAKKPLKPIQRLIYMIGVSNSVAANYLSRNGVFFLFVVIHIV